MFCEFFVCVWVDVIVFEGCCERLGLMVLIVGWWFVGNDVVCIGWCGYCVVWFGWDFKGCWSEWVCGIVGVGWFFCWWCYWWLVCGWESLIVWRIWWFVVVWCCLGYCVVLWFGFWWGRDCFWGGYVVSREWWFVWWR